LVIVLSVERADNVFELRGLRVKIVFIACGQSPIYTRILGCLRRGACYKRHDCLQEMQPLRVREKRCLYTRDMSVQKGCLWAY
jgi:hypothetical protein